MRFIFFLYFFLSFCAFVVAQQTAPKFIVLKPTWLFDGEQMLENHIVMIKGNKIVKIEDARGKVYGVGYEVIELNGKTVMPGMIEGHSHLFLHPYSETKWDDQVLLESRAERTARAVVHAEKTLLAGFTTIRDLGTEGADFDDVGIKQAIEKEIIPGPRMIVATKALVATGSYGPKNPHSGYHLPKGAAEVDGDAVIKEVREQIGNGADVIKVYADYRWGSFGEAKPTFTIAELNKIVEVASSSGRQVIAHASTEEGMSRAIEAGVSTIEHGNDGNYEIFTKMASRKIALCPTLAADEAISILKGWKKGSEPEPMRITQKRKSFSEALKAGVPIVMGGDVGVFVHGENVREMELLVDFGMSPIQVLRSATSGNADIFGWGNRIGRLKSDYLADIIAVEGNPLKNIANCRKVSLVMKNGTIYKK